MVQPELTEARGTAKVTRFSRPQLSDPHQIWRQRSQIPALLSRHFGFITSFHILKLHGPYCYQLGANFFWGCTPPNRGNAQLTQGLF